MSLGSMPVYAESFLIKTRRAFQILDVTPQVNWVIRDAKVETGSAVIFTNHTTTCITINEAEAKLLEDIEAKVKELYA